MANGPVRIAQNGLSHGPSPIQPGAAAWEARGDHARAAGNAADAESAYLASVVAAAGDRAIMAATLAFERGELGTSERMLRALLRERPTSIAAIRLMAMLAIRLGRYDDALRLLGRALDLAPGFAPAREMLARTLQRMNRFEPALAEVDRLIRAAPDNPSVAMLKAGLLVRLGRQDEAATLYGATLARWPDSAKGWMSYGHVLKAIGRVEEAIRAYRRAIALEPGFGEAWWSLANLKTFAFAPDETAAMEAALGDADETDRLHLHFALGKAYEDGRRDAEAFAHYQQGNRLRHAQLGYDASAISAQSGAMIRALDQGAMPSGKGGCPEEGPIFIIGLPRSGSTLVEQILSSHSLIEGTSELPEMMMIGERLAGRAEAEGLSLPELIARLNVEERAALGREYMERTRPYRRSDSRFFIDKMPNNWMHVALIDAILPHARIIDARRHPMAVGWSAYKQHFARGQEFSYDLGDLGRYYSDYAALMDAFDRARPGRVHRVIYEHMVADTEGQVRALLAHLEVEFEPACLNFWLNDRTVRTPSSQQVRQPVFRQGLDQWQRFERWMEPLREALGPLPATYAQSNKIISNNNPSGSAT
ncbi:sulfotransferase [Sphingobium sp. Sx8-8]|uniref:tetratricopeptide repeat-containing sulfotransferase family protein n=1 Tax=Sphingobium sp. Sx8-8 TaxID=2933617 RepID=UPI001F57E807|nr:sulfotransferase [Sphingobium sp. Sx8-8]